MKKIIVALLTLMVLCAFTFGQSNNYVQKRVVDGRIRTVQTLHIEKTTPLSGYIRNMVTGKENPYSIMDGKLTVYKVKRSGKIVPMNPVEPGTAVSCTCCYCNCSFSTRITTWNCVRCPSCNKKLGYPECIWTCDCGSACEVFHIIE